MSALKNNSKYFGTDGIRGVYGEDLTDGLAMLTGNSLGLSAKGGSVIIGRDTRLSGGNLSRALTEGVLAACGKVVDLGVVPTPCIAFAVAHSDAAFGVMLSASHNPPKYNGIKIFGADGRKLTAEQECVIERHIAEASLSYAQRRGEIETSCDAVGAYADNVCSCGRLNGLKIVLDCANGAASFIAPEIFKRMGADVTAVNVSADGTAINVNCGALHPETAAREVLRTGADLGLSFDGDADRVIAVDERGNIVNGDRIIYVLAGRLQADRALPHASVVGTLHTNMGVEIGLKSLGIDLIRTDIGDHNVIEKMCDAGLALGGEQSGHIILRAFSETGDGILAGAFLADTLKRSGKSLSALADCPLYPQINVDVQTVNKEKIARDKNLLRFVGRVEDMLNENGRIMLRPSGTENKLRIMAESRDGFLAQFAARSIELFVRSNYDLN